MKAKWLSQMFKQADGTWDISRVLMAVATLGYLGQGCWAVTKGQAFDWQGAGIGLGAVVGGTGAGVMMHSKADGFNARQDLAAPTPEEIAAETQVHSD